MTPTKGYYSIVQYCPDPSRGETANIGVVLLVPDRGFFSVRLVKDNSRIRHVFNVSGDELKQLNGFKKSFASRVQSESHQILTPEQLQKFIDTRGNFIQLTVPRFVKVRMCDEVLESLFTDLVGGEKKREARQSFEKSVEELLFKAGLHRFVRQHVSVDLPQAHRRITVPFGFQNGKFNLLETVNFDTSKEDANFRKACVQSMQGRFVHETTHEQFGEMRFNVIGRFASQEDESIPMVRDTLRENDVRLIVEKDLPELVDEIRRTGKEISDPI